MLYFFFSLFLRQPHWVTTWAYVLLFERQPLVHIPEMQCRSLILKRKHTCFVPSSLPFYSLVITKYFFLYFQMYYSNSIIILRSINSPEDHTFKHLGRTLPAINVMNIRGVIRALPHSPPSHSIFSRQSGWPKSFIILLTISFACYSLQCLRHRSCSSPPNCHICASLLDFVLISFSFWHLLFFINMIDLFVCGFVCP